MVTAEVALALPALVIVVAALVTVILAVAAQLRCVAAAREGARAAARGETSAVVQQLAQRAAPDGAAVRISTGDETVTVMVSASVHPLGVPIADIRVSGEATALREPESQDSAWAATTAAGPGAGALMAAPVAALVVPWRRRARSSGSSRSSRSRCSRRPGRWGRRGQRRGLARCAADLVQRCSRHRTRLGSDTGNGTVYVVAMVGVLAVLAGGATLVAKAHVAQQRAAAAADLGALAGARALVDGTADPCTAAGQIVQRNGAQLAGCAIEGETVVITSAVTVRLGGLGLNDATARARAGPVPE